MIKFIEKPNLPSGRVKAVICGEMCSEVNDFLLSRGIERVVISPNRKIDPATSHHADMAAIHLGESRVVVCKSQTELTNNLKAKGFDVIESDRDIAGEYPNDIALNFTVIDRFIIGNSNFADKALKANTKLLISLKVKQGYCKCSSLVVDENAVITDDKSIHNIADENGIDSLLVSKGDILLPGHEYGFIGGASGKISESEVLFFGDVTKHRDYKKIADFIKKHGCEIISLNFPLTDFGGIIPITEKTP